MLLIANGNKPVNTQTQKAGVAGHLTHPYFVNSAVPKVGVSQKVFFNSVLIHKDYVH